MSERAAGELVVGKMALFAAGQALAPLSSDRHPALVYLARLTKGSRRVQLQALRRIAELLQPGSTVTTLHWEMLRYQHTQAVRSRLADLYAPATANRMLAALRGVLREAWRLELVDRDTAERACDLAPVAESALPAGRYVTGDELSALMGACFDWTVRGARDAAMVAILAGGGLRRDEAGELQLRHLEGGVLTVRGKGNKTREVPLGGGARGIVEAWLVVRGRAEGPLLCHVVGKSTVVLRRLTGQGIHDALRARATKAGIRPFTPHDLRRTYASDLLDAGVDLSTVKNLLGHAKVETTTRYDRRGETAKRRAVEALERARS